MQETPEVHANQCPLRAVHRRLGDLHRQWHQAEQAYFDPDAFRVAIQTAIQTSRTVTFILQSNKRAIPEFDAWYGQWQTRFANIPLMRWMVDARNKIEKQGDLEAHSFVRAELVASHLDEGPVIEVPAELTDAPLKLLRSIPDSALGTHLKKDGFLRIQRRWVENSLPEFELLDAVATAYGHLSTMLSDAHRQIGLEEPLTIDEETGEAYDAASMGGRMPCMIGHSDLRTLDIWLATGEKVKIELARTSISLEGAIESAKRYPIEPKEIFGNSPAPEEQLKSLFAAARTMFLKDGYHVTIAFLLRGGRPVQTIVLNPDEHGEKYIMMRKIAQEVTRKGAEAVIMLGEVWSAPFDSANPYRRAADSPDRTEALQGTLVSKAGEPRQLFAQIIRNKDLATLGQTVERDGGAQFMFAPIYEAWGKPIPSEWFTAKEITGSADRAR